MAPGDAGDAIVIGGGLAGLACGVALADCGVKVTLLEREAGLGGRAASRTHRPTGDRIDIGPHVLLNEYRNFLALLERLGTRELVTWQPRKLITLVTDQGPHALRHRPLPPPLSLVPDLLRAPGLGLADFWSNNRATWAALTFGEEQVPALDALSGLELLRALGASERIIDWFWKFESMAVMNAPLERVSAAALMRVHRMLIGHRGIHFGFPAVGLGDLYAEQARRAIEAGGGRVLRARALAVETVGGTHEVVCQGSRFAARCCVIALPPRELGEIRPGLADVDAFGPSPYVSTYLWFDRRITDERFWALLWTPTRLNYDFYDLANIRPAWRGRPSVIACNLIYSYRADGVSDAALVEAALREIAEFAPGVRQARLLHADVHRIPMAICLPAAGTERRRPSTRTAVPGLYLAGDWTRTGYPASMEGAVFSGHRAAEAVLAHFGRPAPIALPPPAGDGLARLARPRPKPGTDPHLAR